MNNCNCGACAASKWHGQQGLYKCTELKKPAAESEKTVTHEGNIYEIGKHYLFSDWGICWQADKLRYVENNGDWEFKGISCSWRYCKPFAEGEIGTITLAPVKLVDGDAYMFDYKGRTQYGIYSDKEMSFVTSDGWTVVNYCTNIRRMLVEVE